MATITPRPQKDGSKVYGAQIRICRNGENGYQEAQTFARHSTANAWVKKRESALAELERVSLKGNC